MSGRALWRRHDGYVLRAFWGSFFAVLLFFTLMIVVVDLAERLKRVLEHWGRLERDGYDPLGALLRFYGTLIPFVWLRIVPFAAPMAAAFALARLSRHQELTPLVASGVSTRRIVAPMLLSGLVLAGLMVLARATVVPGLNRDNVALGRLLSKKSPDRVGDVRHIHDGTGARLSVGSALPLQRRVKDVFVTRPDASGAPRELLSYPLLIWDDERRAWFAPEGGTRIPLDATAQGWLRFPIEVGARAPLATSWDLLEILMNTYNSLGLSFEQSAALVASNPDNAVVVVRHHEQFTLPLSTLVLLGLTIPFCLRLGERRLWPGFLWSLVAAALYFLSARLLGSVAAAGALNPVVLSWLPVVVFGSLAVALLAGMRS